MPGTSQGGRKASIKIKELYGSDYYHNLGAKGGAVSHPETRTFRKDRKLARQAGRKGGLRNSKTRISKVQTLLRKIGVRAVPSDKKDSKKGIDKA